MTRSAERTAADGDVGESRPPLWLEFSPSSLGVIDEPRARARSSDRWYASSQLRQVEFGDFMNATQRTLEEVLFSAKPLNAEFCELHLVLPR